MQENELKGPIAYAIAQSSQYNTTDQASKLEYLNGVGQEYIAKGNEPFYDIGFLETHIAQLRSEQRGMNFSFTWLPENPHGAFLDVNTQRESVVMPKPITIEDIEELIRSEPDIRTIVIAVYSNGYSCFRDVANHLRTEHPNITLVAGAVGTEFEETKNLAKYQIRGNQLDDMRRLLGEPVRARWKIPVVPSHTSVTYDGIEKMKTIGLITTSYGCPYDCDFCPSVAQYKGRYITPYTAEEIVASIHKAHELVAPDSDVMSISLADPQGLGDVRVWKEVFRICRDMGFSVELATTTSSKILRQYTIDELVGGDLSVSCVNIGVESMLNPYSKNRGVDLKEEIKRYTQGGIKIAVTFIIGHDWHTADNVWEDVQMVRGLDASGFIVSNMMMEPGTPLFQRMKSEGRLLDVPPEFYATYGFQAFTHPYFQSGFNDMTPVLSQIEEMLTQGTAVFSRDINIFLNRKNPGLNQSQGRLIKELQAAEDEMRANRNSYTDIESAITKRRAKIFYDLVVRNIDFFHPYINWNV